jgi:hypothetical protein
MPKKKPADDGAIHALEKHAAEARTLIANLRALFPDAHAMAADDRRRSLGRVGDGESRVLQTLVDAMELRPALFAVLADEDDGDDPEALETSLIRKRFAMRDTYAALAAELHALAAVLEDEALAQGALALPVTRAAYEIAKPVSRRDAALREKIAPALDYYGANAAAAAAARKANKGGKAPG